MSALPLELSPSSGNRRLSLLVAGGALLLGALWYFAPEPPVVVEPVAPTIPRSSRDAAAGMTGDGNTGPGFAARSNRQRSPDLFASHSWYVPPPPPPPPQQARPTAPTAPPLPYTFLGSYEKSGDKPVYFLVRGDRVHDVRPGDILENTYAVGNASRGQLQLTYLPLKQDQWLSVGSPQ